MILFTDCVPDPQSFDRDSEAARLCSELKQILCEAKPSRDSLQPFDNGVSHDLIVEENLHNIGVHIGGRVIVGGAKVKDIYLLWSFQFLN